MKIIKDKVYSKRQLADMIIEKNDSIFIVKESLMDDLNYIYRLRKLSRKIYENKEIDDNFLINVLHIIDNIFGLNAPIICRCVLSEDEVNCVRSYLLNIKKLNDN